MGFQILNHITTLTEKEREEIYQEIVDSITNGDSTYWTDIVKEFKFEDWEEARKEYESNMSKGKIILKP